MGEKDDGLRLSLSLGCGGTTTTMTTTTTQTQTQTQHGSSSFLKLNNLTQKPSSFSSSVQFHLHPHHQKSTTTTTSPWNELFQLSDRNSDARSFLRGLDVNRAPQSAAAECYEEENGVSSPNSTVSSISGKRSEREAALGGEEAEEGDRDSCSRGCGGGGSDDDDGGNGGGDASRKKLRLTKDQSLVLEETFKEHNTLNPKQKLALAKQLNLRPRQVEVWFQNRRARTKLKQTEVDCEYLKRCCENLTEENRRLQKEVQELRALKLSPQLYMHMSPPTTLTMCPSCERVAVSSSSSSAAAAAAPNGPNRQPAIPSIPRPVPINPWAALPIQHRQLDPPASRS